MLEPADIINRALDALGTGKTIGSMVDGTTESEAGRRIYGPTLRQLLRAANWAFARKRAPIQLLGDSTGQTPTVGTQVEPPWLYVYAWPIDGVRARWLPWNGITPIAGGIPSNITLPSEPTMPSLGVPFNYGREIPARFLCAVTDQYPVVTGQTDWQDLPDLDDIEGVGPNSRRIVLTNVPCAQLVYTFLCKEPTIWDDLFSEAMVAVLASRLAMAVLPDKKMALAERNNHIAIAKNAIREARVASAQESGFRQTVDRMPDWIRGRRAGRGAFGFDGLGGEGPGYTFLGCDSIAMADGSVF